MGKPSLSAEPSCWKVSFSVSRYFSIEAFRSVEGLVGVEGTMLSREGMAEMAYMAAYGTVHASKLTFVQRHSI
jgi:hypothetical protein